MSDSRPGFDRAVEAAAVEVHDWRCDCFTFTSACRGPGPFDIELAAAVVAAVYGPLVEALTTQLRQQVLHEAVLAVHNARFYNPANAAMDTGYGGVREAERALYRIGALLQLPNDQHPNGYPPPSAVEGLTT